MPNFCAICARKICIGKWVERLRVGEFRVREIRVRGAVDGSESRYPEMVSMHVGQTNHYCLEIKRIARGEAGRAMAQSLQV